MKRSILYCCTGVGLLGVIVAAVLLSPTGTANAAPPDRTQHRPISDFLSVQGTTAVFNDPVPDQIAWTDPITTNYMAQFDYAGLANAWTEAESGGTVSYGTTTSGTITERPLADGRAEVTIILHTQNALTWAVGCPPCFDPHLSPVLFGNKAPDALATGDMALGDCFLHVVHQPGARRAAAGPRRRICPGHSDWL